MNAIPHMLVADSVLREFGLPDCSRAHGAVGAIAPDAYRLIPGMGYRALHFRSRRTLGMRRVDFVSGYLRPALIAGSGDEQAFWIGWFCHIVSDQVWRRMLRTEVTDLWDGGIGGAGMERERLRAEYHGSCDCVDRQLADLPGSLVSEFRWLLRSWNPHYELALLNFHTLREWAGRVALDATPPPEPELPPAADQITYAFVARAMEASHHEIVAALHAEISATTALSPDFEDASGMEFV
jgi:hypothetical protein